MVKDRLVAIVETALITAEAWDSLGDHAANSILFPTL
jgi:hypothetical protein